MNNRLIVYNEDRSEDFDLYSDYGGILLDGYVMNPPEAKSYTIDIPGHNGTVDLSNIITGGPIYGNRSHEFSFLFLNPTDGVEHLKSTMSKLLQGKIRLYSVTMDPGYFYRGRFTIESFERETYSEGVVCRMTLTVDTEPFKIKQYGGVYVNTKGWIALNLNNGSYPIRPVFKNPIEGTKIIFNNELYKMTIGNNVFNDVILQPGSNTIYVNYGGYISVTWGDLHDMGITYGALDGMPIFGIYNMGPDPHPTISDKLQIDYDWRDI